VREFVCVFATHAHAALVRFSPSRASPRGRVNVVLIIAVLIVRDIRVALVLAAAAAAAALAFACPCQTKSAASPHGLNPSEEVQEGVRALEDGNPYVGMRRKKKDNKTPRVCSCKYLASWDPPPQCTTSVNTAQRFCQRCATQVQARVAGDERGGAGGHRQAQGVRGRVDRQLHQAVYGCVRGSSTLCPPRSSAWYPSRATGGTDNFPVPCRLVGVLMTSFSTHCGYPPPHTHTTTTTTPHFPCKHLTRALANAPHRVDEAHHGRDEAHGSGRRDQPRGLRIHGGHGRAAREAGDRIQAAGLL